MRKKSITGRARLIFIALTLYSCNIFALNIFALNHRVMLAKDTWFISGSLALNYEMTVLKPVEHKIALNSDVGGGYFVMDRLAVGASLPAKWTLVPKKKGEIGLSLFGTYFFDIDHFIVPYAGIDITPGFSLSEMSLLLSAGINGGVLISLSNSVALDFGISPEFYFPLTSRQRFKLTIPAGFIGVRAFF